MSTAPQMIEQGKMELSKMQFTAAETSFQNALNAEKKSVEARIGLARISLLKGEKDKSQSLVDEALKFAPENAEALSLKGVACMQRKMWKEAVSYLEKARRANPHLQMTYVNLAKCYRKLDNFKDAEQAIQMAIQLDPKDYLAHAEWSILLIKTKRAKAGFDELILAIRLNPLFIKGYLRLGRLYQAAKKFDLAIELYRAGLKQNPVAIPLREALATAYGFVGDFHKAYNQLVYIAIRRGTEEDWLRVGNCAVMIGQFEKAEKAFKKAREVNPNSGKAHFNLGELYFAAKLYEKAKEQYNLAMQKDPKDFEAFNGMGLLLLAGEQKPAEAKKYLFHALELAPGRKEPMLNMALALYQLQEIDAAKKFAEATMRVTSPGDRIYNQAKRLLEQ